MALIKCPDCGTSVSDAAAKCPNCSRPIASPKNRNGEAALSVLFGLGLCWLWFGPRVYIVFPFDTGIMGIILLISGVVLFARQAPAAK